jgi:transglutaminase-like putative cysteine protease
VSVAAQLAVLLPAVLSIIALAPVLGANVTLLLLLPALLLPALALALVVRTTRSVLALLAVSLACAAAAGVLVAMLSPAGTARGPAFAAFVVALTGAGSEVLVAGRHPVLGVVPSALLLTLALALGASTRPGMGLLAGAIVVAGALLLLVVGPWNSGPGGTTGATPTRSGVVMAVAGSMVAGGAALAVHGAAAPLLHDPVRLAGIAEADTVVPPTGLRDVDPIAQATRWQTIERDDPRLLVTVLTPAAGQHLVWVTLPRYDGTTWGAPTLYGDAGPEFYPDPATAGSPLVPHVMSLRVGPGLPGPWVPNQTQVRQVVGAPVATDGGIGSVVATSSPIGRTFEVRSQQAAVTAAALVKAAPATVPIFADVLNLPSHLPSSLRRLVDRAAEVSPSPFLRMRALAAELRSPANRSLDPGGFVGFQPGRSLGDIDVVLQRGAGLQEQYAAAFALGARDWNVPTRLVVGWLLPAKAKGPVEVRAAMTSVWAQAYLAGAGWVTFQPTPQDRDAGRPAVVLPPAPAKPKPGPSASATKPTARPTTSRPSPTPTATATESTFDLGQLLRVLLPVLVLAAWPLLVAWLRRRRRRTLEQEPPDPKGQVAGAWTWARTALWESGLALRPGASPDVVAWGDGADDLPPEVAGRLRILAATVSPALYGPEEPAGATAGMAWEQADAVVAAVRAQDRPSARVRRLLVPGRALPPAEEPDWVAEQDFGRTVPR